ncbi:MAG TPA: O-antigen ligase family protein [Halococcus sp.]|nr:O-antigen ligase family protein [Halococcus sp.]
MRRQIAAYALVLAACATVIPDIPRFVSFTVFGVVFVAVGAWALLDTQTLTITARPGVLVGTLAVWLALVVGLVRTPTLGGSLRVGAFVVFTGAALFVLPSVIPRRDVYRATASAAAAFVFLGLLAAVFGALGPVGVYRHVAIVGVSYGIPLSLFANPNTLASVALLGGLAASGIALSRRFDEPSTRGRSAAVLAGVCVLAVALSGSRAALLALVAGGGVLAVAQVGGPRTTTLVTLGGLAALVGVLVIAAVAGVNFSGRLELWDAAIRGLFARPVFGWGPGADAATLAEFLPSDFRLAGRYGTHSSYFRLFFIGGIVGGIGYLLLCASGLRGALAAADRDGTTLALCVAVLVFFIFENGTVFGIAPASFIGALVIGYAQQQPPEDGPLPVASSSATVWQWDIDSAIISFRGW